MYALCLSHNMYALENARSRRPARHRMFWLFGPRRTTTTARGYGLAYFLPFFFWFCCYCSMRTRHTLFILCSWAHKKGTLKMETRKIKDNNCHRHYPFGGVDSNLCERRKRIRRGGGKEGKIRAPWIAPSISCYSPRWHRRRCNGWALWRLPKVCNKNKLLSWIA